jgi:predicted Fe-S protein YdhL (DUF1289 family)
MAEAAGPGGMAVKSPCIGVCRLSAASICVGCWRTVDEIARWSTASDGERRRILTRVALRRADGPPAG